MPNYRLYLEGNICQAPHYPDIIVDKQKNHYLKNVLRLKLQQVIDIFDDNGKEYTCKISHIQRHQITLTILKELPLKPKNSLNLTLAIAIIRSEKFEWMLQKITELGVNYVQPIYSDFSQHRFNPEKTSTRLARWKKTIISACEQCQRNYLARISVPITLDEFLSRNTQPLYYFDTTDTADTIFSFTDTIQCNQATLLIGPEGGWSKQELQQFRQKSTPCIRLGEHILRSETAAIVAATLFQYHYGNL